MCAQVLTREKLTSCRTIFHIQSNGLCLSEQVLAATQSQLPSFAGPHYHCERQTPARVLV
jgi:hypothetical protein